MALGPDWMVEHVDPAHPPMVSCTSCDERVTEPECDKSERGCGHHCNHSWSHDRCCWCGEVFA